MRFAGYVALGMAGYDPGLMTAWLKVAAGLLGLAECLGILEELV